MPLFFDNTMLILIPAIIIAAYAQFKVKSTFQRFSKVSVRRGLTGFQTARRILDDNGLFDTRIEHIQGHLSDHYDPTTNTVRLSDSVYGSSSVAAVGVAAHEVGHAIQHATAYVPIKIRMSMVKVTGLASNLSMPLLLIGLVLANPLLAFAGVLMFGFAVIFQLVTLPVEFNASSRALKSLESFNILDQDELKGSKKVLSAAALTYVAALISSLASMLRLILIANRTRRK